MRKSRSVSNFLFRTVCIIFSVLLLVLTLLARVELMRLDKEIEELYELIEREETESRILTVKLENRISLSELEDYAAQILGMHRPTAQQLYFISCDAE